MLVSPIVARIVDSKLLTASWYLQIVDLSKLLIFKLLIACWYSILLSCLSLKIVDLARVIDEWNLSSWRGLYRHWKIKNPAYAGILTQEGLCCIRFELDKISINFWIFSSKFVRILIICCNPNPDLKLNFELFGILSVEKLSAGILQLKPLVW